MSDFEYINTRVMCMRSSLMDPSEITDMLETDDDEGIIVRLMNSPYGDDLADAIHSMPRKEAIDCALNNSLHRDLNRILSFAGVDDRQLLKAMVSSWDVQALKSLLRGVRNHVSCEDIIKGIGPVTDFTDEQIHTLAGEPDPQALISHLATWSSSWAGVLLPHLVEYDKDENIQLLEQALDRHRFERVSSVPAHPEKEMAVALLAQEAELKNIIHALTLIGRDATPSLLPQPGRSLKTVRALCTASTQSEALAILSETRYHLVLDKALPMMLMSTGHFAMLERLMDEEILTIARLKALEDPLSIAVPYYYLLMKHNEIMNLRLIANGVACGMQKNALRAALVFSGAA
ncbi:hypothetical protein BVX99_02945 [bacterium F16]|nr:hypothetical protein BVX99_02945 [bacterium F16]